MEQLDLFNNESGNKVAVIRAKQKAMPENKKEEIPVNKNNSEINKEATVIVDEIPAKKHQPQLIKPLSKKTQEPSKRGRKSLKENNLDVALLDVPEDEILFQKQYYSIREVAEWFNMKPSLLRFWENEFDILKPRKNKKGDRLFRPEDVKNLRIIYYLLRQQKYSVEGAKQFLKDNQKKAEMHVQLAETLTKFRSFLLELKANLGA
jgi:DNA-binding transcriptional MerR regulator